MPKCENLMPKCETFVGHNLHIYPIKKQNIMNSTVLIIILIALPLAAIVTLAISILSFRRRRRERYNTLIRNLRERDNIARELERTRMEKEIYENLLIKKLTEEEIKSQK